MSSKILAVDTATENCSVALKIGTEIIAKCENAPREHSTKILPMINEVLAEAQINLTQLDVLAFGRGPGSFTGVRIGIGIAQGLAFGADLPLVGISTLAAMAVQAFRVYGASRVISAIDARMNEIYVGAYSRLNNGEWQSRHDEQVCAPDALKLPLDNEWFTVGTGWKAYPSLKKMLDLPLVESQIFFPEAQDMLVLAHHAYMRNELVSAEMASPIYLRDNITWKKLAGR